MRFSGPGTDQAVSQYLTNNLQIMTTYQDMLFAPLASQLERIFRISKKKLPEPGFELPTSIAPCDALTHVGTRLETRGRQKRAFIKARTLDLNFGGRILKVPARPRQKAAARRKSLENAS